VQRFFYWSQRLTVLCNEKAFYAFCSLHCILTFRIEKGMISLFRHKKQTIKIFAWVFLVPVAGSIIFLILLYGLVYGGYFGTLPNDEAINNITTLSSTEVVDSKNQLIGKFYIQDRTPITIQQISPEIIKTLILVEDIRFFEHKGVDMRSMIRVLVKSIFLGDKSAGGGSTITQQLAKNLFPRKNYKYLYYPINKLREIIIAKKIERQYTKFQILTLYLNTVSFGQDIYGIESASRRFFNKPAVEANFHEAAMLIGMLKASTSYNPLLNPDNALSRRNFVLQLLYQHGQFDNSSLDCYQNEPLLAASLVQSRNEHAAYFMEKIKNNARDILDSLYRITGVEYNLFTDGLTIHTSLDNTLQTYAEEAVKTNMAKLQKKFNQTITADYWKKRQRILDIEISKLSAPPTSNKKKTVAYHPDSIQYPIYSSIDSIKHHLKYLQAGFLAINPKTGQVLAWVGGINHQFFPFDHVRDARRQAGSTMKPIIYAAALEKGISPCSYYKAEQVTYQEENEDWKPSNANDEYKGKYSMAGALSNSVNTVSVKILNDVGIEESIDFARQLGIVSEIPPVPSIVLGTPSLSLHELVGAYATFANDGKFSPLYMIEKITNSSGEIIYQKSPPMAKQVMNPTTSQLMVHMLKQVVEEGTAVRLRSHFALTNEMGGKTGTTQSNGDGWFIGITPEIVAGAWVGGIYPEISQHNKAIGGGSATALPIFGDFFKSVKQDSYYRKVYRATFRPLTKEQSDQIDCKPFKDSFNLIEWLFGEREKEREILNTPPKEKEGLKEKILRLIKKNKEK